MLMFSAAAAHASSGGHASLEPPNFITLIHHAYPENHLVHLIARYENIVFAVIAGLFLSILFYVGTRTLQMVPGRLQNLLEMVVEGLQEFFEGILGHYAKIFVPFLGTLFLYIWCVNMSGLIPLLKPATSDLNMTLALAICVFVTVQYTAFTKLGPAKYFDHLTGQPRETIMYILAPFLFGLFVLLDVVVPPITLSLRLYGNITGGDTLMGAFLDMATNNLFHPTSALSLLGGVMAFVTTVVLRFLALLLDSIQALVFTLLSTIYILMVLPHEEHGH